MGREGGRELRLSYLYNKTEGIRLSGEGVQTYLYTKVKMGSPFGTAFAPQRIDFPSAQGPRSQGTAASEPETENNIANRKA